MNLPLKYTKRMQSLLGAEYGTYLDSLEQERFFGLRANTLKISPETLAEKGLFRIAPVPWCAEGFYYDGKERPAKHPYYHAGLYYLQEPSAMTPAAALPVSKGDRVLDLCAAPGGKTTQLAAKLGRTGVLFANDVSAGRAKTLLKNVELAGIRNAVVLSERPERAGLLCSGGLLLYSTCTFSLEGNEESISVFLQNHPEFRTHPIPKEHGFAAGLPPLTDCARLYPHKIRGEGHFLALLEKTGTQASRELQQEQGGWEKEMEPFADFAAEILREKPAGKYKRKRVVLNHRRRSRWG